MEPKRFVLYAGLAKCASSLMAGKVWPAVAEHEGYRIMGKESARVLTSEFLPDIPADHPLFAARDQGGVIVSLRSLGYEVPYVWRDSRPMGSIYVSNITSFLRDKGEVVLVIRRQDDIVNSWLYFHNYNYGGPDYYFVDWPVVGDPHPTMPSKQAGYACQRLANRYGAVLTSSFDYYGLYMQLANHIDPGRIHILLYEDLKRNPDAFLAALGRVFGADLSYLGPIIARKENPSRKSGKVPHPYFLRGPRWDRTPLLRRAWRLLENLSRRSVRFDEDKRRAVLEMYVEGNRRLAEKTGLDLARYGYF